MWRFYLFLYVSPRVSIGSSSKRHGPKKVNCDGFPVFYEENHQIPMRSMDVNDVNERFPVLMIPVSKITGGFIKRLEAFCAHCVAIAEGY